jgi:hypothetical protein
MTTPFEPLNRINKGPMNMAPPEAYRYFFMHSFPYDIQTYEEVAPWGVAKISALFSALLGFFDSGCYVGSERK